MEDMLTTTHNRRSRHWLKTSEAALRCRVTAETVIAWAKAGLLTPSRTPGGHYRFDAAEVDTLMNADSLPPAGDPALETPRAAP